MSLLTEVVATSLDPGYVEADRLARRRRAPVGVGAALLVVGLLVGVALLTKNHQAAQVAAERSALIKQVRDHERDNERLRGHLASVQADVDGLRSKQLGAGASATSTADRLGTASGTTRVVGPGVQITVDDSTTLTGTDAEVLDQDLRQLVNGLWTAGAEAIAINGHRLSARTAIRGAGSAITVDYSSLTRPYVVSAIGDPKTLPARFQDSTGGQWWAYLRQNYGMRYEVNAAERLVIEPDSRLNVSKARPPR